MGIALVTNNAVTDAQSAAPEASGAVSRLTRELVPFIGESGWAKQVWRQVQTLASDTELVAFVGESGTGKTLLAQHLHWQSERAAEPCVIFDLRQLQHDQIEAELFGDHRADRFTARQVGQGRVVEAGAGTLILQGFEYLPATIQERCLPWFLEGQIYPLGAQGKIPVAARVVLEIRGRDFARGRGWSLIPPIYRLLKDRVVMVEPINRHREDILPLAQYYVERYAREWGISVPNFTTEAIRLLKRAQWHCNVRDIIFAVASALAEAREGEIDTTDFPPALVGRPGAAAELGIDAIALEAVVEEKLRRFFTRLGNYEAHDVYETVLEKIEKPLFRLVLEQTHGNQVHAARILGINRNTLRARLKKYGMLTKLG